MNDKDYIGKSVSKSKVNITDTDSNSDWYSITFSEPFFGLVLKDGIIKKRTTCDNEDAVRWDLIVEMDDDWHIKKLKRLVCLTENGEGNDKVVKKFPPDLEHNAEKKLKSVIYKRPPSTKSRLSAEFRRKAKKYHDYAKTDRNNIAYPRYKIYHVICEYKIDRRILCDTEIYFTMKEALESQLETLDGYFEFRPKNPTYIKQRNNLKSSIALIEKKRTDKGVKPAFMNIDAGGKVYHTLAYGYWDDYVRGALDVIEDRMSNKKNIVNRVKSLRERKDKCSDDFMNKFEEVVKIL